MKNVFRLALLSCICVLLGFAGIGCEDKPNTDGLSDFFDGDIFAEVADGVEPGQLPMRIGPSGEITLNNDGDMVEITLEGASGPVSWDLPLSSRGQLVTRSLTGATYRRLSGGDNVVTATDRSGRSVSKVIKQPAADPPPASQTFAIVPEGSQAVDSEGNVVELTLTANEQIAKLRVVGADGNVTWTAEHPARGNIVTQSNTAATYERFTAGDNVVRAEDASGQVAFKVIRQP